MEVGNTSTCLQMFSLSGNDSCAIQEFSGSCAPDCGSGRTDSANCTDVAVLATHELPAKKVFYCVKYTFTEIFSLPMKAQSFSITQTTIYSSVYIVEHMYIC